jgi:hypothetical protein
MRKLILILFTLSLVWSGLYFTQKSSAAVVTTLANAGTPLSAQSSYTWHYPITPGCEQLSGAVPVVAYQFTVTSSGNYTFTMNTSGFTGVIHLYQNSFDPNQPCLNQGNPQNVNVFPQLLIMNSPLTVPLTNGFGSQTWVAVFSAQNPNDTGTFSASVSGPAAVTPLTSSLSIFSQPSSKSVTSGCQQTLAVYANGPLPQSFQWYEGISGDLTNSILIVGATSHVYTTPPLTSDKSYWLRITQGSEHVDSQTIEFKVYAVNKTQITGSLDTNQTWNLTTSLCHPTGTFVHYGTTQIRIPVAGNYTTHIDKGNNFSGGYAINLYSQSFDATFPCSNFADSSVNSDLTVHLTPGTYIIVVSATSPTELDGNYSGAISGLNECTLPETIEQALLISGNPLDKAITPGNNASLTLAYTGGSGALKTIQWYSGFSGDISQPITLANFTSYTTPILNQSPPNQPTYYYYWARVTDAGQGTHADTRTAVINVLNPPITYSDVLSTCDETYTQVGGPTTFYKIFPFTVSTDGSYTFSVSASGFTPAVRLYQGFFSPNFPNINYYGPGATQHILASPNTFYLVITSTAANQTGSFTLTVSGPALVIPTPRPVITAQPTDKVIFRDQTTTLSASSSTPDVSYQWYRGTCTNKTAVSDGNLSSYTTPPMTDYQDFWVKVSYGVMYVNSNIAHVMIRPVAVTDGYIIDEDTLLNVATPGVLSNDRKADSKTLTAFKVTDPILGTRTLNGDGSLSYTPNQNANGPDVFMYKVSDGILESPSENIAILVRSINDAPTFTGGSFNNHTFNEDSAGGVLHLGGVSFGPGGGGDEASQQLTYKVTAVPPANVGNVMLADHTTVVTVNNTYTISQIKDMEFKPAANGYGGPYPFTVTVTDNGTSYSGPDPKSISQSLNITVNAKADIPTVTSATTNEDTQTTSGLVIDRNVADSTEVAYFKIGQIRNGTVYKNDGITQINSDQFITYAEGHAGLKFKPNANQSSPNTTFSFEVQASLTNMFEGTGGATVVTITVNPVADLPSVTGATTFVNLQTSSGLVVTRNPVDGSEIGYYKISSITNGTLYKANGVTQIGSGQFITAAEGTAGLKFTPAQDSTAAGSFIVQGSADASGNGLSAAVTANITVGKYGTATTISSVSPAPSYLDQAVTVNYSVLNTSGGPVPTGNVVVTVSGGAETCTGTVAAGSCTLTLTTAGNPRTITAAYGGNSQFNSNNGTKDHVVNENAAVSYAQSAGNCGLDKTPCFSSVQAAMAAGGNTGTVNILGGTFNESLDLNTNVTVNVQGDTTINSLSMSAGTLNGGSFVLTLSNGNWTNDGGTFNPEAGTVSLSGAGQTIEGVNATTFNGLIVGAGGATLNAVNPSEKMGNTATIAAPADITINGLLTLNGDLTTMDDAKVIMSATATSSGSGDVVGNLQRQGFVTGACEGNSAPCPNTLSFGNPNNQITITSGTAPSSILVKLTKSAPATYAGAVQRNYDITESGGNGFIATLRLHYLDSELNGNTPETHLTLRRFDGSSWIGVGPTQPVDTSNNWVENNAVQAFSTWTFSALAPTAADGLIKGRILAGDGTPVAGAVVRLSGTQTRKTITDANGYYHFSNVESSGFYTVTPSRVNYNFSPFNRSFSQLGGQTEAVFDASFNGDTENPLDTPEYFIRQQYVDVLGREPDESGFNFWSDRILECGSDTVCVNSRRRDVAAQFFIAQEFQQSGSFIYNLYKVSLGRRPLFAEFSMDRQQVVGGFGLEAAKQAFAESFVQRAEFESRYQSDTTAELFVDSLLANVRQNAGVDLGSQRATLISRYGSGANLTQSRSFVLGGVTEMPATCDANYNSAFVLTEYFGYLRRNPDQAGYDFWLNVLNESAGRDTGAFARMVCSFITSAEYQQRFSQVVSHGNGECAQ